MRFLLLPSLLALLFLAGPDTARAQTTAAPSTLDPSRVVTAESCGECHVSAFEVWKKTPHATGFSTLHRQENATEIAERMGFKLIKRDSVCLDCHYTPIERGGGERADSGVSCESCHGAGRDYLDVHNDYGGKGVDHTSESPEHRRQRIEASVAAGMRRPSDLYAVASNCYGCHAVPNEKLVNVGRHSLGSSDFELASWTQGVIRHNFLDSFLDGDGTVNAERPVEHRRRLAVIGRVLAVEHSLRGLAEATEDGVYSKALQRRLRGTTSDLRRLARATGAAELEQMVEVVRGVKPRVGEPQPLLAAAERIAELAHAFLDGHDGTRLAMVDPILRGEELDIEAEPSDEGDGVIADTGIAGTGIAGTGVADAGIADAGVADAGVADAGTEGGGTTGTAATRGTGPSGGSPSGTVRAASVQAIPAEGDQRSHLRPRSDHDTLEATACQKCHGDQNAWWFDDRHYASIEPFLDRAAAPSKIARLYGISPSRMARGDSLCMDCHGTVATGRESREVQDGVSCQSCHGPGADFLEPHQEGDLSLGLRRPGFQKALKLGMKNLHDLETAVRNCASCHYVTDPRLISSGHPSGLDFDIVEGMPKVRHWRAEVATADRLRSTWQSVLAERGAVPRVRRARLAQEAPAPGASSGGTGASSTASPSTAAGAADGTTAVGSASGAGVPGDRPSRVEFRPRPADARGTADRRPRSDSAASGASVPSLPELEQGMPVEEVLRRLQLQLEELYRALGGPPRPHVDTAGGGR